MNPPGKGKNSSLAEPSMPIPSSKQAMDFVKKMGIDTEGLEAEVSFHLFYIYEYKAL